MNYPQLNGIIDLVALQNAVALVLLSDDRLATVPVLTELKLHMDNEIAVDALWTLPRAAIQLKPGTIDFFAAVIDTDGTIANSGPTGAGLLVEMPSADVVSRGVTGPPLKWNISVVAIEERNVNLTAQVGHFIMAEQLAQLALNSLHLQHIFPYGQLAGDRNVLAPAKDWEDRLGGGKVCWRATVAVENGRIQTTRSLNVVITFNNGLCVITCPDPGATILYTLDGTPAVKANPSSLIYQGPFDVDPGDLVVASSWKDGTLTASIVGNIAPLVLIGDPETTTAFGDPQAGAAFGGG